MASALCEVKDGAAAYVATANGVDVTVGNTIVVRLASQAGVDSWSIACITVDDTSSAAAVNAGMVIDSVAKTATFAAPAATGKAWRFLSTVVSGGVKTTAIFVIYTRVNGNRVHALDETTESNATAGWGADINALIRTGGGGAPGGNAGEVQVKSGTSFAGATNVTAGAGYVGVGAALPTTGAIRLADGSTIMATTSAIDRPVLNYSAGTIVVGDASVIGAIINRVNSAGLIYNQSNGVNVLTIGPNGAQFGSSSFALGGGVGVVGIANATTAPTANPTSGAVVYAEGGALRVRGAASGGSIVTLAPNLTMYDGTVHRVVAAQSGGEVFVGCDASYTSGTQASNLRLYPSTFLYMGVGSTSYMWCGSNIVSFSQPVGGGGTAPFKFYAASVTSAASVTLTSSQFICPFLTLAAGAAAAFTIIAPLSTGAVFIVYNSTAFTCTFGGASGATVSIAAGATSIVVCDGTNYRKPV